MFCIYCDTPDKESLSHIIPEALGKGPTLKGAVCESCNHAISREVGQGVIETKELSRHLLNLTGKGSSSHHCNDRPLQSWAPDELRRRGPASRPEKHNDAIPYYARDRSEVNVPSPVLERTFFWPTVRQLFGHIPRKSIDDCSPDCRHNLIRTAMYLQENRENHRACARILVTIAAAYYEVLSLVGDLGRTQEVYAVYSSAFDKLHEGQNDLFNVNEQLAAVEGRDVEVIFKALLDKYHSLYEGNVRYTLAPVTYALDIITGHKDSGAKSPEEYASDDVSYKLQKIENAKKLQLQNPLDPLLIGIEPHLRNAISHRTFEYLDSGRMRFVDRAWSKQMVEDEFSKAVLEIDTNLQGQLVGLTIFFHDYGDRLDLSKVPRYSTTKQLLALIDQIILRTWLYPKSVRCDSQRSLIHCEVLQMAASEFPSKAFGFVDGVPFQDTRAPLDPEGHGTPDLARNRASSNRFPDMPSHRV